jgi:hypothetical protein
LATAGWRSASARWSWWERRSQLIAVEHAVVVLVALLQGDRGVGKFLSRDLAIAVGVERRFEWMRRWRREVPRSATFALAVATLTVALLAGRALATFVARRSFSFVIFRRVGRKCRPHTERQQHGAGCA